MNRLLQKLKALLPCSTETNRKVFTLLDEVRDSGSKVNLRYADGGRIYRCSVVALSEEHRVFVVTDSPTMVEAYSAPKSSRLTVAVGHNGRSYNLSCKLIGPLLPDHSMGYQLQFKNLYNETWQGSGLRNQSNGNVEGCH
jgi:hypothetical protein